jgi:hypothetical protein
MGLLIDTSVFIDHERGRLDLGPRVQNREEQETFLSVGLGDGLRLGALAIRASVGT